MGLNAVALVCYVIMPVCVRLWAFRLYLGDFNSLCISIIPFFSSFKGWIARLHIFLSFFPFQNDYIPFCNMSA